MAKVNKTIDKDLGAKRIANSAKKIRGSFSEIGVHETAGKHQGDDAFVHVAEVAFWNTVQGVIDVYVSLIIGTIVLRAIRTSTR